MKGVELPVNVMVMLVIAVIVLFSVLALFLGIWSPVPGTITPDAARSAACLKLMTGTPDCLNADLTDIHIGNFDADKNGVAGSPGDNLMTLCNNYYDTNGDQDRCRALCNCK